MKKNNERILKYLAGIMTEDEKRLFEKELDESVEIKAYLTEVKNSLSLLQINEGMIDERYFSTLLPKVHKRLERKSALKFNLRTFYYLAPTVAVGVMAVMLLFKPVEDKTMDYKSIAKEVVNNLSDAEVYDKYAEVAAIEPETILPKDETTALSTYIPEEVEINTEVVSKYINDSAVEEYSIPDTLDKEELEKIASSMNFLTANR